MTITEKIQALRRLAADQSTTDCEREAARKAADALEAKDSSDVPTDDQWDTLFPGVGTSNEMIDALRHWVHPTPVTVNTTAGPMRFYRVYYNK